MQKECQKNKYNVEHIEYSEKIMDMHEKMEKHSDLFALHLSCHLKEDREEWLSFKPLLKRISLGHSKCQNSNSFKNNI